MGQLHLLRHWPITWAKQQEFGLDLDFEKVECARETFFELRLHDSRLSQGGNLRVFFWVHDAGRTVWIIHGYWKKTQQLPESVKRRVARRVRELKGQIQDGSVT